MSRFLDPVVRTMIGRHFKAGRMQAVVFAMAWTLLCMPVRANAAVAEESAIEVTVGFKGVWKLGQVCPIKVTLEDALSDQAAYVEARTVDGDGVEVAYRMPFANGQPQMWIPIRVGAADSVLQIVVLDAAGQELQSSSMIDIASEALASDQPLVLALGSALGLDELVRFNADRTSSNFTVVTIDDARQLPPSWRDYLAVDLLVLATNDADFLQSIGPVWGALHSWLEVGGGCVLSLTPDLTEELQAVTDAGESSDFAKAMRSLLPGAVLGKSQISNPGALESRVATGDRLSQFSAIRMEMDKGGVELSFSDSLSRNVPWWTTHVVGQGTVTTLASDLDASAFRDWQDRKLLWERLVESYLDSDVLKGTQAERQTGDSSYLGYNDLIGQLRATMDVFADVRVISFGQISAILVVALLLVGPVDYLVSVRWLKRPQFSWYFSAGCLILVSAVLTWYGLKVRPSNVFVNSVQLVDIDSQSGVSSGHFWAHVYSGSARRVNLAPDSPELNSLFLDWQGLPGRGLGGLNSQLGSDRGMPPYRIDIEPDGSTIMRGVGIAAGGTKAVSSSWVEQLQLDMQADLKELPGVDQVAGEFTNPLSEDIKEGVLFYHNWFYRLNSRIPPGSRVTISSDTIPKDIGRKLNERNTVSDTVASTKWDPAARDELDRLLELLMFHKAATGSNYSALSHRYQPVIDHSNLLDTDHAILIGRLDNPRVSLKLEQSDDASLDYTQTMERVWFRMLIPVTPRS